MHLLVVFGSQYGHTRKVALFLQKEAERLHHTVTLSETTELAPSPFNFDAVIVLSAVYAGNYNPSVVDYIARYADALNNIPAAFLSINLSVTRKDGQGKVELENMTDLFLSIYKWKPVLLEYVGGALAYSKYGFFKKLLMRSIAKKTGGDTDTSKDYEYTDWNRLQQVLKEFVARYEPVLYN